MHIHAFWGTALEIGASEGEDVASVPAGRNPFVCDRAVVEVFDCLLQFLEAELQTRAAREQLVLHILYPALGGEFRRPGACGAAQIRAFGEDHEPHWTQLVGVRGVEFLEAGAETFLVFGPFARHEDEAVELHRGTYEGHPFQVFFEDDVDVAVGGWGVGVGDPPEVEPVGVELVVGH